MSAVVSSRVVDSELTTPAPIAGGLPALFREPTPPEQDLRIAEVAFRRAWPRREGPKARQQLRSNIEYQRYLRNRLAGDAGSFVRRFTDALDEVLAPVVATLDNLPAYFDPRTAPEHFLDWLAAWVGLELFERWPPELRRPLVADAVQRHRERGTKLGVQNVVALFAEVDPEQRHDPGERRRVGAHGGRTRRRQVPGVPGGPHQGRLDEDHGRARQEAG